MYQVSLPSMCQILFISLCTQSVRSPHRKCRGIDLQPSCWLQLSLPGWCLVSLPFLCSVYFTDPVLHETATVTVFCAEGGCIGLLQPPKICSIKKWALWNVVLSMQRGKQTKNSTQWDGN